MITWSILSLDSFKDTGIVVSANWKCSNAQVSRTGNSVFAEPSENLIPYSSLTEQDILNWIWTDGGVDKNIIEESVTKELDAINNPVVVKNPLPWI